MTTTPRPPLEGEGLRAAEVVTGLRSRAEGEIEAERDELRADLARVAVLADEADDELLSVCPYFGGDEERRHVALARLAEIIEIARGRHAV